MLRTRRALTRTRRYRIMRTKWYSMPKHEVCTIPKSESFEPDQDVRCAWV